MRRKGGSQAGSLLQHNFVLAEFIFRSAPTSTIRTGRVSLHFATITAIAQRRLVHTTTRFVLVGTHQVVAGLHTASLFH